MLAILGGTGIYALDEIDVLEEYEVETPFGSPSGNIVRGRWGKHEILFLARHGKGHRLLPHEINFRANIFALKSKGATQLLGLSAVGSLTEEIAPGHLVTPGQFFDWTKGRRQSSFFGQGIAAHVSTAEPVSEQLAAWVGNEATNHGFRLHNNVTYACIEGPRLGTRTESKFLRNAGCQVVGMTNVPEAFLAREAQICYASLGIVTDYDCWMENPEMHVKATEIFKLYAEILLNVRRMLGELLKQPLPPEEQQIRTALSYALLTPADAIQPENRRWLDVLAK